MHWNGELPIRRYAIFTDARRGCYMIVVRARDIHSAEK